MHSVFNESAPRGAPRNKLVSAAEAVGRNKLRSRTPDRAVVDWAVLGLWRIQLFAIQEPIELGEVRRVAVRV